MNRVKRAVIAEARSHLGYREKPGNVTLFGDWYGLQGQPWCAMFVSFVAKKAGAASIIPRHAFTPAGAKWFKDRGRWHTKPKAGALAYFYNASLGRIAHVGIVEKVFPDGSFYSLEGNTNAAGSREGTMVRRQRRRSAAGFGYPAYGTLTRKST